ncbi:uncharacterized protein ISCGN_006453 [Ixodes scapularis]
MINDATTLLNSPDIDLSRPIGFKERLTTSNAELDRINEELEPLLSAEEFEDEYAASAECQGHAVMFIAQLGFKIAELENSRRPMVQATATTTPNTHDTVFRMIGSRLPKLDITTFRGDVTQWQTFWEQYEGTIHSNRTSSTMDKFHYLRRYLTGETAAAIAGLPTTEACYADAIQLLKQGFGDQKRIEQVHLAALRNLPRVRSSTDTMGLRNLYATMQLNIRSLNSLNVPTGSFAAMLCDILITSMPHDIVVQYYRQVSYKAPNNAAAEEAGGFFVVYLEL